MARERVQEPQQQEAKMKAHHGPTSHASGHYRHLFFMLVMSFAAMFVLMYAMVNSFANVYGNVNQLYMAALMSAPMAIIEIAVMRAMYQDKRMNAVFLLGAMIVGVGSWMLIRQQAGVSDRQFLRSMIPHHASALLMCEKAPIEDADIKQLCRNIIAGQQAEIDQMKAKLDTLSK
jgi:uncharacterized protein (DUF305 family)